VEPGSWLVVLVVAALVAIGLWLRGRGKSVQVDRGFPFHLRLGVTRVGEGFSAAERADLLAYLNAASARIYVAPSSTDRVREASGAVVLADGRWQITTGGTARNCEVAELVDLAPSERFGEADLLVMNRAACEVIKKDTCVRRVAADGKTFLYSYKAPEDLARCLVDPSETCQYELLTLTVQTFSDKDCQTAAGAKTDTFAHCHPA
jgi:hypothetical protein